MYKVVQKLKIIIFLSGLGMIWFTMGNILQKPKNMEWNMKGMEKAIANPQYYDVLFSGTSMTILNISAEELYLQYGIASVTLGEPEQTTYLSYYTVEEALKYQTPKAVIFDVKALFYTEDRLKEMIDVNEDYYVHYTLDGLKNSKTKYDAVTQVKEISTTTYLPYFSKMVHNHSNWEEIGKSNFKLEQSNDFILESRSILDMWENVYDNTYISLQNRTSEKVEIPKVNKVYVEKMAEICKKKGIDFILIRGTGSKGWSWGEYNAVEELAKELDIDYVDLALYEEQIGFNWRTDSADGRHLNVNGAKKWTDFLGKYLIQKHDFIDHRGDINYKEFQEAQKKYEYYKKAMDQKISLMNAVNFVQYMDTLFNMEKDEIGIFLTVSEGANNFLTKENQKVLNLIGFNIDLENKSEFGYLGILEDGRIVEENCSEDGVSVSGKLRDGTLYKVSRGESILDKTASIMLNGEEVCQNGNGFNFVVYSKETGEVLSSVFFDTSVEENPTTARKTTAEKIEIEKDINCWDSDK